MADSAEPDPITGLDDLQIPPFDVDDFPFSDDFITFEDDDDVFNFFNFDDDDLDLPSDDFLNTIGPSDCNDSGSNIKSPPEFVPVSGDPVFNFSSTATGERSSSDVVVDVSGERSFDEVGNFNVSSSDSRDSYQEIGDKGLGVSRVLNYDSPELEVRNGEISGPNSSQGSDDCARSVDYSPNSGNWVVDQKNGSEESGKNNLLKRKKEDEDANSESRRTNKSRRSTSANRRPTIVDQSSAEDGDEKRKARLIRNRESAQLSRQKKKQYVEELEDKVRAMHSTIQDLNAKISYITAENANLKQQMNGGMAPPPMPGMYPHPAMAPMGYPWTPYPPYLVKPQGSQVPRVPIPRLIPQTLHDKTNKNGERKKKEGKSKTKKVASVSFLGLLFFVLLFGGLVPMVNVKYGKMSDAYLGRSDYIKNTVYHQHHDSKILAVNGTDHEHGTRFSTKSLGTWKNYDSNINCQQGHVGGIHDNVKHSNCGDFADRNVTDPLFASLYVPRNDKLVKIDGNLIIHSVLASEEAVTSLQNRETKSDKNSLAVPFNPAPLISSPEAGQNGGRHPHLYRSTSGQHRVLLPGSSGKDNLNLPQRDGELQQWFREGLAGPVLRSGMCTEVFQFDVSPTPGAITPVTSVRNISMEENQNTTRLTNGGNRKILQGLIPLPGSANFSEENVRSDSKKEDPHRNISRSPMVVSVLVDPREVGDLDGEGILGRKPLSRIFVVVLLDSVKYVTYSCMLPFKGTNQLVTA